MGDAAAFAGNPGSRNRARNIVLLTVTLLLAKSTWFSAAAVMPQLRREWDLSDTTGAWLTIAVQLGFVAGALISAILNLADVMSPQRIILGGAIGAAGANALLLLSGGAGPAIVSRAITGAFIAAVYPPALKLVATWYRTGRGTAMGVATGALTASTALPHLVNGLGGLDWRIVVSATSVLTVLGGLIVASAVREGPYPFPSARLDWRQVGSVISNRSVRLASLGYMCHMWELYAMWTWFAVFFADSLSTRGHDPWPMSAYVTFAVLTAGAPGNWVGGIIGDRYGRERAVIGMLALSGTCAAFIGLLREAPLWILVAVGLVWGFSVVGDSAQFSTLVTELAPQRYVGTALTLQMAAGFALTGVTIWLVPATEALAGWQGAFLVLLPGPVLGIVAMRRLRRVRNVPVGST